MIKQSNIQLLLVYTKLQSLLQDFKNNADKIIELTSKFIETSTKEDENNLLSYIYLCRTFD